MNKAAIYILAPVLIIWFLLVWNAHIAGAWATPLLLLFLVYFLSAQLLRNTSFLEVESHGKKSERRLLMGVGVALSCCALIWAQIIYSTNPIAIEKSDILPLIKEIYYTRFVSGEYVYAHVDGYDYKSWTPNYLPMHWMPFVPAFYWGIDPRWVSLLALLIVFWMYAWRVIKLQSSIMDRLIKIVLPFAFLFSIFLKQSNNIAHTVELLIASFYMLLALGLTYANKPSMIIGFTTTLLSRYMSVFYLPIDCYVNLKSKNKGAWVVYLLVFLLILGLYIIPFVWVDPYVFFKGAAAYDIAAVGEWNGQAWQNKGDLPYQLFQGYGFASWFYKFYPGELLTKILALKTVLLIVLSVQALVLIILAKKHGTHPAFKPTALLLTIILFTSFVLVPYNYLFWNLLFVLPPLIMNRYKL